jgi:hypothetical protein
MAHRLLRTALLATPVILSAHAASAVWLQCQASGSTDRGPTAFFATIVDVGPAPKGRVAALRERLAAYATRYDSTLTGVAAQCFASDDPQVAASRYSRDLDAGYRRLGWDHVIVVQPADWLAPGDIVSDPSLP